MSDDEKSLPGLDGDSALTAKQKASLLAFIEKLEKLPVNNPDDGFSAKDHDAVIYHKDW